MATPNVVHKNPCVEEASYLWSTERFVDQAGLLNLVERLYDEHQTDAQQAWLKHVCGWKTCDS